MTHSVNLETFFRRVATGDEVAEPQRYLAGFQEPDGNPWGMIVPLDPDDVDPTVLKGASFALSMEANGTLGIEAEGRSDLVTELISASSESARLSLDIVVRNALQPDLLAMEDDALAELTQLRDRLIHALELVDDTMRSLAP